MEAGGSGFHLRYNLFDFHLNQVQVRYPAVLLPRPVHFSCLYIIRHYDKRLPLRTAQLMNYLNPFPQALGLIAYSADVFNHNLNITPANSVQPCTNLLADTVLVKCFNASDAGLGLSEIT